MILFYLHLFTKIVLSWRTITSRWHIYKSPFVNNCSRLLSLKSPLSKRWTSHIMTTLYSHILAWIQSTINQNFN